MSHNGAARRAVCWFSNSKERGQKKNYSKTMHTLRAATHKYMLSVRRSGSINVHSALDSNFCKCSSLCVFLCFLVCIFSARLKKKYLKFVLSAVVRFFSNIMRQVSRRFIFAHICAFYMYQLFERSYIIFITSLNNALVIFFLYPHSLSLNDGAEMRHHQHQTAPYILYSQHRIIVAIML